MEGIADAQTQRHECFGVKGPTGRPVSLQCREEGVGCRPRQAYSRRLFLPVREAGLARTVEVEAVRNGLILAVVGRENQWDLLVIWMCVVWEKESSKV